MSDPARITTDPANRASIPNHGLGTSGPAGPVVAVIDVQWLGSLPTFHLVVVDTLLALGCRVVSFSPDPDGVQRHCAPGTSGPCGLVVRRIGAARPGASDTDRPVVGTDLLRRFYRRWAPSWIREKRLRSLALSGWEAVRQEVSAFRWENRDPIDQVVFPYLDHPIISLSAGSGTGLPDLDRPWSGLWVHPDPRKPALGQLRSVATSLKSLRYFGGFWSLDESLPEWADGALTSLWLGRFPDVTDEDLPDDRGTLESEIMRLGSKGPVVLLAGELSARKGVHELLLAANEAQRRGSRLQFVVAGPLDQASCDREVRTLDSALRGAPRNLHFLPGWIPDGHEFNAAVRAASVIWAAYRDFPFSSNLLTKAAMIGRPVLVSDGGLLADRVRAYGLGRVVDPSDPEQVVSTLESTVAEDRSDSDAYASYYRDHSARSLSTVLKAVLPAESAAE